MQQHTKEYKGEVWFVLGDANMLDPEDVDANNTKPFLCAVPSSEASFTDSWSMSTYISFVRHVAL